ncbi:MAG: hypothetical protein FJX62_13385 [Alphaproteobacteria bacterium]|nr:hypothetical protein [Alphaproteobacteria bacterium]
MESLDHRVIMSIAAGLVLLAGGGFYFALTPRAPESLAPVSRPAPASAPAPSAPAAAAKPQPATPESVEAEIAKSDHAELQALLKRAFPDEYRDLIAAAVQTRNEGASDADVGRETFTKFQSILRANLKFAVGASTAAIDRLAANEIRLFAALGAAGSDYCLAVLGRSENQGPVVPPDDIRRLMRLATLHRFEAIVEGRSRMVTVDALSAEELKAFEAVLAKAGLTLNEIRSGEFLNKEGDGPGKPCVMVDRLYRAVAQLDESPRCKLFVSMFFMGRDR